MTQRGIAALVASLMLAGCGGGSGGTTTPPTLRATPSSAPAPAPAPSATEEPTQAPTAAPTTAPTATPAPATAPAKMAQILGAPGWTSPNGFTLYVFGADSANVSNCNNSCALVWPPFMAAAGAKAVGSFAVITRSDGSHQWTYKSKPLYNFSGDSKAGDANGEGLVLNGGIWHVARP